MYSQPSDWSLTNICIKSIFNWWYVNNGLSTNKIKSHVKSLNYYDSHRNDTCPSLNHVATSNKNKESPTMTLEEKMHMEYSYKMHMVYSY